MYKDIDIGYLHECFILRPDGRLIWRTRPRSHFSSERGWKMWNSRWAATIAGWRNDYGYIEITVDYVTFKAHRIVFAMTTGAWPSDQLDHRNGIRHDNRPDNLREAAGALQQQQNMKFSKRNASGFRGVGWHKASQRWRAYIGVRGRTIHLGLFDTPEEAHAAHLAAKKTHHPFQPEPRLQ